MSPVYTEGGLAPAVFYLRHPPLSTNFHMLTIWCYPDLDKNYKLSYSGNTPDRYGPAEFIRHRLGN